MSIQDLRNRTAERKKSGASQTYPEHKGKQFAKSAPKSVSLPLVRSPCHYEGEILSPCHSCGSEQRHVRDCELHGQCTRGEALKDVDMVCERCPNYTSKPRDGDVLCGVAIGSYKWPELVELQIRSIRALCGPVPILVSNDHPESTSHLQTLCGKHPDVTLISNPERIGHCGGDLAVYHRAVGWGAEKGLSVVAKLSQRFFFTRAFWLQDGARELIQSGLAIATRNCEAPHGGKAYPVRSEVALLDLNQWNRPEILDAIKPGRYWHLKQGGWEAEDILNEIITTRFGAYWPWSQVPPTREGRGQGDGFLWHHSHSRSEYETFASQYRVTLPESFHVGGWEGEYEAGQYLFG